MINDKKTTDFLENVLISSGAEKLSDILEEYSDKLIEPNDAFTEHMRSCFAKHSKSQKNVFIAANISEKYGYALVSTEKHTKQRDQIIKLCLAGHFDQDETDRALILYGMSPLYARNGRDAILILSISNHIFEISDINETMITHSFEPLYEGDL